MATMAFTPAAISRTCWQLGGGFMPRLVRDVVGSAPGGQAQTFTVSVTVAGAAATLAKVGGAAWLTIPETCEDGVAFDVEIDARDLVPGDYSETIRASAGGFDDADCVVTLAVRPTK